LLTAVGDTAALDRIAFDLSLYWEERQLQSAIEPGEHAAKAAEAKLQAAEREGRAGPDELESARKAVSHVGDLQMAMGRSGESLARYQRSAVIAERLAALDPANAEWQRELSVSYNRVGGVLEAQGDLAGALGEFRTALEIAVRLAALDPANAGWQRYLDASYNRVGGVLEAQVGPLAVRLPWPLHQV
jgi:tetratricopeptide (TPR) repeat protein